MTGSPIIRLNNVTKHYDNITAVDAVTLDVRRGEILVLLGSSGCGKTTLLRLIAGLERPNAGEVWLDSHLIAGRDAWVPPEQRQIGMVFQDYALFPHLTVAQNIAFALNKLRPKQQKPRIEAMLALVGLSGVGERFPHQLSGGQQQRVALARAMAPDPAVVLLDEPFSNLDAALRKFMRDEVRRILQAAGATAVFVTHDQEEAMSIADRVAVLNHGRLLQVGTPGDLYRYPKVRHVATFLGEANMIAGHAKGATVETALGPLQLTELTHGPVDVMVRPEAIVLHPHTDGAAQVAERRFFGHYQLIDVRLSDGSTVEARVWAQSDVVEGQRVDVSVNGDVVAFRGKAIIDGSVSGE